MLPREVILALVLVDLPIALEDVAQHRLRDGYGESWFYITCEGDDHYVDVVEDVLSLCTYRQARELCFISDDSGVTLLSAATERCRTVLQRSLRFVGRFEFAGSADATNEGYRQFEAIDYGTRQNEIHNGRRVILKCYTSAQLYQDEVRIT